MTQSWKDRWTVVGLIVIGVLSPFAVARAVSPARYWCDTWQAAADCWNDTEGWCPNHCMSIIPGCSNED